MKSATTSMGLNMNLHDISVVALGSAAAATNWYEPIVQATPDALRWIVALSTVAYVILRVINEARKMFGGK